MKTVKFLSSALLCSFLAASTLLATESVKSTTTETAERNVRSQIVKLVSDIALEDTGAVYVKFKVSAEKGFQLIHVKSESSILASNVERIISRNAIVVPASLQGLYEIRIRFAEYDEQNRSYASR